MNAWLLGLLLAAAPVAAPVVAPKPTDTLVDVADAVPRATLDIRYATTRNFLHEAVYAKARCLLLPRTAAALARAEARLEAAGLRLLLWDCYRPLSVQKAMWAKVPVRGLVADPYHGGSFHNRGTAVDAAVVDLDGKPVPLPSDHDDFTRAGRRDTPCADPKAARNRAALIDAMTAEGFTTIRTEWWHFDGPDAVHAPVLDLPL